MRVPDLHEHREGFCVELVVTMMPGDRVLDVVEPSLHERPVARAVDVLRDRRFDQLAFAQALASQKRSTLSAKSGSTYDCKRASRRYIVLAMLELLRVSDAILPGMLARESRPLTWESVTHRADLPKFFWAPRRNVSRRAGHP